MNFKKSVLSSSSLNFTVSAVTRYFTDDEVQSGLMEKYIESKAHAGHYCHVFDYTETFKVESHLSRSSQ